MSLMRLACETGAFIKARVLSSGTLSEMQPLHPTLVFFYLDDRFQASYKTTRSLTTCLFSAETCLRRAASSSHPCIRPGPGEE